MGRMIELNILKHTKWSRYPRGKFPWPIGNSLPVNITYTDSHAAFRRALKTRLLTLLLSSLLFVYGWTSVLHSHSFMYKWAQ